MYENNSTPSLPTSDSRPPIWAQFALSFAGKNFHDFLQGKPLQSCLRTLKKHTSYQGIELLHVSFGKMDSSRKSFFSYGKSCPDSRRKRFCHEEDDIETMMKTEVAQICRDELPIELSIQWGCSAIFGHCIQIGLNVAVSVVHFLCILNLHRLVGFY